MHEVLVNRLGGLSLPRKSVVRLTDRPDMTLDVYRGRKTTMQQQQLSHKTCINTSGPLLEKILVAINVNLHKIRIFLKRKKWGLCRKQTLQGVKKVRSHYSIAYNFRNYDC